MNKQLSFDLPTVFDNNILETIAKKTGWDENNSSIENWILMTVRNNIKVNIELERTNTNKTFIKTIIKENNFVKGYDFTKEYMIPLIMCKEEFINQLMKLCGYNENNYYTDNLIQYIMDSQLNNKEDIYTQLYIELPILEN